MAPPACQWRTCSGAYKTVNCIGHRIGACGIGVSVPIELDAQTRYPSPSGTRLRGTARAPLRVALQPSAPRAACR
jgi:hypothetical protein